MSDTEKPSPFAPGNARKSSITLSTEQSAARDAILKWWKYKPKQIFTVAGYAGVGKSSVVNQVIEDLQLTGDEVAFVTFTGKASLVLTNKGVPAITIHRLIYAPIIQKYRDGMGREKERVTGFKLKNEESLDDTRLIVVDEVSMVGAKLLADLASYKIPMLVLGDPEQLPPVQDNGNKLLDTPDVFLTEIHRQAAGNPILWASAMIRQGYTIPYGVYGGGSGVGDSPLTVVPRSYITPEHLVAADQVLCGRNETRRFLNERMRQQLGFSGLPQPSDKVICLKNNWDEASTTMAPLVNGWIARVTKLGSVNRGGRTCTLSMEDWDDAKNQFHALEVNLDYFETETGSKEKPNTHSKVEQFDFGNAVTVHKYQGSEAANIIYIHEPFGGEVNSRRLAYTGATRASRRLVYVY